MAASERIVLAPRYVLEFSCIGPECEDTCCKEWRVNIDQETYKAYRRVRDPELRTLLDKAVGRNRSNPTPESYARIRFNEKGFCPLLTEEGLCRVHRDLGEDYLSDTCSVYPRRHHMVDGVLERSLTLSCPEAARKALLNEEPMEFEQFVESAGGRQIVESRLETRSSKRSRPLVENFWDVRAFVIRLLQSREYAVWERLVILGLFVQKLEQTAADGPGKIANLVERYEALIADGSLRESLAEIPAQTTLQFRIAKELVDLRFKQPVVIQRYIECLGECLAGLKVSRDATFEGVGERYRQAYSDFYLPYMSQREYIYENYLVNHVFKNRFPLGTKGAFAEYVMLVIHYALIKLHLIGMAAYHRGLTDELVVKVVQSIAKTVEHNSSYLERVYNLLEASGFNTMPYMAILVKN